MLIDYEQRNCGFPLNIYFLKLLYYNDFLLFNMSFNRKHRFKNINIYEKVLKNFLFVLNLKTHETKELGQL